LKFWQGTKKNQGAVANRSAQFFFGLPRIEKCFVAHSSCENPHWLGTADQMWFSRALPHCGGLFVVKKQNKILFFSTFKT